LAAQPARGGVAAFAHRRHGTAVAALRVAPVDRLVQRRIVSLLHGALMIFHVRAVKRFADRAAAEGAKQRARARGPELAAAAADSRAGKPAENGAAGRADGLLRAHAPGMLGAVLRASAQRQRRGQE